MTPAAKNNLQRLYRWKELKKYVAILAFSHNTNGERRDLP